MLIDAKKLWVEGGYSQHNPYEVFIARVRKQAQLVGISEEELNLILVDFFIDLRKDPMVYRTIDNVCQQCSCGGNNSGTNATHYIFNRIKEVKDKQVLAQQESFIKALNEKITTYMAEDNERYTALYGPERDPYWYEIPTFISWYKGIVSWLSM